MSASARSFGYVLPFPSLSYKSRLRLTNATLCNEQESLWGDQKGMPSMKKFIDREEGDPESDDEEIEVQGAALNYKDPITFGWLTKPVKR